MEEGVDAGVVCLKNMKLKVPGHKIEIDESDKVFLSKFASSDLLGLLGGDWIKLWRWNNLLRISKRIKSICEKNKLDPKEVAPKFLQQFFEQASLEEEETLQEMWANLLLNESLKRDTNIFYINILKELEYNEAELLRFLFKNFAGDKEITFDGNKILKNIPKISENKFDIIIEKLYSFKLLKPIKMTGISAGGGNPSLDTTRAFNFTTMGINFCEKVTEAIVKK